MKEFEWDGVPTREIAYVTEAETEQGPRWIRHEKIWVYAWPSNVSGWWIVIDSREKW